ncbi:MAG: hypothetical protein KDK72_08185, partial [Chlamydiia bacterium]|nr:hypothetical protein [Chlamydiia bacterium]
QHRYFYFHPKDVSSKCGKKKKRRYSQDAVHRQVQLGKAFPLMENRGVTVSLFDKHKDDHIPQNAVSMNNRSIAA